MAERSSLTNDDLIREKYRGIRPAPGYPACPDHTEKRMLFDLLQVERHAGITLTESFAMLPAAAVSGLVFRTSRGKIFCGGKDRQGSSGGLCPSEGNGPYERSNAGSRPT